MRRGCWLIGHSLNTFSTDTLALVGLILVEDGLEVRIGSNAGGAAAREAVCVGEASITDWTIRAASAAALVGEVSIIKIIRSA
jgi:hypothetical protein